MELKTCVKCKKDKPLNDYALRNDSTTGRRHTCIKCRTTQRKNNLGHEQRMRDASKCQKSAQSIWDSANPKGVA